MLALSAPADLSALNLLPAVVEDLRQEVGCYADVRIRIGATRLVARLTRQSVQRLELGVGSAVFAIIKSVAIDGRGLLPHGPASPRRPLVLK